MLSCDFQFEEQSLLEHSNPKETKYSIAIIFGSERYGFEEIEKEIPLESRVYIPMNQQSVRSFNLGTFYLHILNKSQ